MARDGVKDGFLQRSARVHVRRRASAVSRAAISDSCLTAPQIETMKRAYAAVTLANGEYGLSRQGAGQRSGVGAHGRRHRRYAVAVERCSSHTATSRGTRSRSISNAIWRSPLDKVGGRGQRHRSGPARIQSARREAPPLSRLERPADLGGQHRELRRLRASKKWAAGRTTGSACSWCPASGIARAATGPDQVNWMARARALARGRTRRPTAYEAARVVGNRIEMTRPLCPYPQIATVHGRGQHERRRRTSSARRR